MTVQLRELAPTPLPESLRRLESLVSPHVGVVQGWAPRLAAPDDAPLVSVTCELCDAGVLTGLHLEANAGGYAETLDAALAAAIGEAIERYAAAWIPEEVVLASANELGPEAVDPSRFALFHEAQHADPAFPPQPFTRSARVRWVRGFALPGGEPALLPVQLVFLTAFPLAEGEALIGYPTSNGLACGGTIEEAILSGLLELLERDAFMLTWTGRLSLPLLDHRGDPKLGEFHARYVAPTGLGLRVVDLSAFHNVPTALALVRGGEADVVAVAVGAAAAASAPDAWRKAVCEAFAVRVWARSLRHADPERAFETGFADVRTFADHVHLYALEEHARHAAFLDAADEVRAVGDVPNLTGETPRERIEALARRLQADGMSAYAVDVTPCDVRGAGLSVVKVLVPELCPLDVAHAARFLGGTRLYRAAWELGLRSSPLRADEVNPYPHPFP